MNKPKTPHFSLAEFERRGKCPQRYWRNIQRLMDALEVIRDRLGGKSITITPAGGYRSAKVNKQNKGRASKSQHLYGRAADIQVKGADPAAVYYVIQELQQAGLIPKGGLAAYPRFVHVDIRGRNARWKAAP